MKREGEDSKQQCGSMDKRSSGVDLVREKEKDVPCVVLTTFQ